MKLYVSCIVVTVIGVLLIVSKDTFLSNESENVVLASIYKYNYIIGSLCLAIGYYVYKTRVNKYVSLEYKSSSTHSLSNGLSEMSSLTKLE